MEWIHMSGELKLLFNWEIAGMRRKRRARSKYFKEVEKD